MYDSCRFCTTAGQPGMQGKSNFYDEQEQEGKSKCLLFTICYFNYLIPFGILLFAISRLKLFLAFAICFLTKKPKSKTTETCSRNTQIRVYSSSSSSSISSESSPPSSSNIRDNVVSVQSAWFQ